MSSGDLSVRRRDGSVFMISAEAFLAQILLERNTRVR